MINVPGNNLYNPFITKIPMLTFDLLVNYSEQLDNTIVVFPHYHNYYEFFYCLEGTITMKIIDKQVIVPEGYLLIITPGIWHEIIYDPNIPHKYFAVVFDYPKQINSDTVKSEERYELNEFELLNKTIIPGNHYLIKDKYNCDKVLNLMKEELFDKEFGWQIKLRNYYLQFFIDSLRNIISSSSQITYGNNLKDNLIIQVTKYMHLNYSKNITQQDVADAFYVTPRHLCRLFEDYFGTSFSKTLRIYRLNYAKNYLCNTDYSVEKIANLVGFTSSRTLYKLFKEIEGITISQYRLKNNPKKKVSK